MVRNLSILFLIIYSGTLFGHGMISAGHSILHMTSEIIALHDHGHDHDVADHGEVFKPKDDNEESKSAHFNMLTLVFFYAPTVATPLETINEITSLTAFEYHFIKSRTVTPATPPPLG